MMYLLTHTRLLGGMEETVPEGLSGTTIDNAVFEFLEENNSMCSDNYKKHKVIQYYVN